MSSVIQIEDLSKYYRLGLIGGRTLREDVNRWMAALRGKPDPALTMGVDEHGGRQDGEIWALKDVNLEIQEGEILGIIGRNGAGKSTLLKILSRITAPTTGRVKIRGRVGSLLEVGTGFHPELTGRENIFLNGAILGMTRREIKSKIDEIINFSEVEQFIDTPVKRYSSGMMVRLAFSVAAHLDPEILVVDEVLAVGDIGFQKKCMNKMSNVASEGRTVLFVSHNLRAIQRLCPKSILLDGGRFVIKHETGYVINEYIDRYRESASSSDLQNVKRDEGLGELARVNNISCMSVNNKSDDIKYGEYLKIYVSYFTRDYAGEISVVLGINSYDGTRVITVSSEDEGVMFQSASSDMQEVVAHIPSLTLLPGIYSVSVALSSGGQTLDLLTEVSSFEVSELCGENVHPTVVKMGSMYMRSEWEKV